VFRNIDPKLYKIFESKEKLLNTNVHSVAYDTATGLDGNYANNSLGGDDDFDFEAYV